jgi:hypothetical protein
MARIPLGDQEFAVGTRVAAPQRGVLPTAQDAGAGIGQELERAGAAGMQIVDQQQRQADALRRQQEAEAKQQQREANRVRALTTTAKVQNGLNDLNDEFAKGLADGTIDKTTAAETWAARSQALTQGALEGVDEEHRPLVEATLADNLNTARKTLGKLVDAKDKADLTQGASSYLEEMQRHAARGGAQADEAIRSVEAFIPSIAGRAGLDAQKTVQAFKENVRFRQASDLVMANPAAALQQLKNPEFLPDLDPNRRAALVATADAAVLRQQERARIEAERIAREQQKVFDAAMKVFEAGRTFTPEYADFVQRNLAGSPYAVAMAQIIKTGPQNAAAATLPVQQQVAALDTLRTRGNTEGSTPALEDEIKRREKVLGAVQTAVKQDALGAANDYGVVPTLRPLQITDIASLPQQLGERVSAARTASVWAGQPVSPLRPMEAEQLTRLLAQLPPDQKASALATLGSTIGDKDQLIALARQIDGKDRNLATALMYADTKTTKGRYVSELILRGEQAQRDGKIKEDRAKETGWRASIATEIGNAYPNEELRQRMVDASYSVLLGLAADGKADVSQAVRLATGGVLTQKDDSKLPLPYGWTERDFTQGLRTYPADKLPSEMRAGQATVTREQVQSQLPNALLVYAGQGRYAIRAGSTFITDAAGRRVILDFSEGGQ